MWKRNFLFRAEDAVPLEQTENELFHETDPALDSSGLQMDKYISVWLQGEGDEQAPSVYTNMASLLTSAVTLSASPALSLPSGFDQYGRPVGLQLVAPPRGEAALLAAGALYEQATGLANQVPIDPREGTVPPVSLAAGAG